MTYTELVAEVGRRLPGVQYMVQVQTWDWRRKDGVEDEWRIWDSDRELAFVGATAEEALAGLVASLLPPIEQPEATDGPA